MEHVGGGRRSDRVSSSGFLDGAPLGSWSGCPDRKGEARGLRVAPGLKVAGQAQLEAAMDLRALRRRPFPQVAFSRVAGTRAGALFPGVGGEKPGTDLGRP